jgi:hypothetical protein
MARKPVRIALLVGAIAAVAVSPARAQEKAPAASDPCMRTIQCTEWVAEKYKVKRTAYKYECKTETYDAFRCESVPVVKERTCVVVKRVPETRTEVRKVCCPKWVCEERTVMRPCYETKQVTCMEKRLVSRGHWESRCEETCLSKLRGSRNSCDPCYTHCPQTRERRVWVHCPQYRECPVTRCQKVCVMKPVKVQCRVCKMEYREEKVQVCSYRCVEEKVVQKYTVCETRQVACKATRTVRVCVPYEVEVECCRMVPKTVTRQVAAAPCQTTCAPTNCCERRRLFDGCRRDRCDRGCNNNCAPVRCERTCNTGCRRVRCDRGCDRGCDNGCGRGHLFDGLRRNNSCCNGCR